MHLVLFETTAAEIPSWLVDLSDEALEDPACLRVILAAEGDQVVWAGVWTSGAAGVVRMLESNGGEDAEVRCLPVVVDQ